MNYVRARSARWGSVLRESGWHGAPNANYYRTTPYLLERSDPAFDKARHEHTEREMQAAVVDRYYRALREKHIKASESMWLQFAASQAGTHKALRQRDKMRQWRRISGLQNRQFYYWLSFALDGLSLYLVEVSD